MSKRLKKALLQSIIPMPFLMVFKAWYLCKETMAACFEDHFLGTGLVVNIFTFVVLVIIAYYVNPQK